MGWFVSLGCWPGLAAMALGGLAGSRARGMRRPRCRGSSSGGMLAVASIAVFDRVQRGPPVELAAARP